MKNILEQVREDLDALIVFPENKRNHTQFFKEKIKTRNVSVPAVRDVAKKHFVQINDNKQNIFSLAESLLRTGYIEEATVAFSWIYNLKKSYTESDFKIFEHWAKSYISNWASCDDFCTHALGYYLWRYPEFIPNTKQWAKSKNLWVRRVSAAVYLYSIRRGEHLQDALEVAYVLLQDKEDMVQKGYGWLLKEIGKHYPDKTFDFVMLHKDKMPRTALRYAIEKLPIDMKQQAMSRS